METTLLLSMCAFCFGPCGPGFCHPQNAHTSLFPIHNFQSYLRHSPLRRPRRHRQPFRPMSDVSLTFSSLTRAERLRAGHLIARAVWCWNCAVAVGRNELSREDQQPPYV
jgi:hypothetical protein